MKHFARISVAVIGVGVSVNVFANEPFASARWNVHDEAGATQLLPPPGGTEDETCSSRLRGQSGWVAFEDPTTYVPDATTTTAYDVVRYGAWRAPEGFDSFETATEEFDADFNFIGYRFVDDAGNEFHATKVGEVVPPARHLLIDPQTTDAVGQYVFTLANFSISLAGAVRPGDVIRVRPDFTSPDLLTDQKVVDCSFTVQGRDFRARAKASFSRTIATFTGPGAVDDYTASVRWMDGTSTSSGQIQRFGDQFAVVGIHRYARAGHYSARVTVNQTYTQTGHRSLSRATITTG